MVSIGGLALSRVSNRFAVAMAVSSPNTSQPKLLAGLSNHNCTSAIICAELHVYCPTPPTDWFAVTVAEKSPPCIVQKIVSKKRCRHVASLGVAGAPSPSPMGAWEGSFAQIGKQLVQLDGERTSRSHRHVHGKAYGCDRRAGWNSSRYVD